MGRGKGVGKGLAVAKREEPRDEKPRERKLAAEVPARARDADHQSVLRRGHAALERVILCARRCTVRLRRRPTPRTKWTRRVPHPVLIGHAASLNPY